MDDPGDRVNHLLEIVSGVDGSFILVGSSIGSYVSIRVSTMIPTLGLFLMAPAIRIPRYKVQNPIPESANVTIVHALKDELIPADTVIEYPAKYASDVFKSMGLAVNYKWCCNTNKYHLFWD